MDAINWELCCLCQEEKDERLQTPKEEGLASIEKDLNGFKAIGVMPSCLKVSWAQLDEGQGIAKTLQRHNAKYHKVCRTYCSNSRLRRFTEEEHSSHQSSPKKLRSSFAVSSALQKSPCCIICEGQDQKNLRKAETYNVDTNLKTWAQSTKNFILLGKLIAQAADAHAGDTHYHLQCYLHLRDSARAEDRRASAGPPAPHFNSVVIAQIVALVENSDSVFKLSALRQLYRTLVEEQGVTCSDTREPHATRFKEYLLKLLPEWTEFSQGKEVYISSNQKVVDLLAEAHKSQIGQDDALLLMRAAVILRKCCLERQNPFTGSFASDSLTSPIPGQLRSFLNILLQGPAILRELSNEELQAQVQGRARVACAIAQQIIYNTCSSSHHATKSSNIRHNKEHETPFPLYQGLKMHGEGRQKKAINNSNAFGVSVSYSRVLEIRRSMARAVVKKVVQDGVVLPTNIRSGVFVTFDVDNLDSNNQGNFSRDEFHGTAISVTNHLSWDNKGVQRPSIQLDPTDTSVPQLPESYSVVQPAEFQSNALHVPCTPDLNCRPSHNLLHGAKVKDESWMAHVSTVLKQDTLPEGEVITWSGYNSRLMSDDCVKPKAVIGVLPLFPDKAATPSMMKHAMHLTMQGTEALNPGQTPVLGGDQPLYAIAKQLQWAFPDTMGEDKLVLMMGALHIEDKMHLMIGKLLRDSGWSNILTQAQVLTSGRAQSVLDEHHIKRTRYAHQVSVMGLYLLSQKSYSNYCSDVEGPPESLEMWAQRSRTHNSMFKFWSTIVDLELLMCRFIRSLREGDFLLYVQVCDELCSWFHVMDHTNYARWLPVHVRDMVQLPEKHPQLYAEFLKGNFVVQRSPHKFSLIGKDQSHEQSNKNLQAHGGAVGLYENPDALALFMLAGPDCCRCIEEFEAVLDTASSRTAHHEEASALQTQYKKDVLSFVEIVEQLGNPFDSGHELVALHTQEVMKDDVVASLAQLHNLGKDLHAKFVTQTLEQDSLPITNTLKRQNVLTFANRPVTAKKGGTSGSAQRNSTLITKLFLSLQSRPDADMQDFFRYENQREPPSLSNQGLLRSGKKSDILEHLKAPTGRSAAAKAATVVVLDMAAVVHMVRPTSAHTFTDYVSQHLVPFVESQVTPTVTRVDAVWDTYPEDNLKTLTHHRRGVGPRTRIGDGQTRIPKQYWNTGFLKNTDNKRELFPFLSAQLVKQDLGGRLLLSTYKESVLSNKQHDVSGLQPCNHIEADTRILLHLAHAAQQRHQVALVRTVDSDVVILAIHFFSSLGLSQLWVCLGSGNKMRDIPIHTLSAQLGPSRCLALPLFHAVTGCDTVSHFLGCGKKSAWSAWQSTPGLTDTLVALTSEPQELSPQSQHMCTLERFVVVMYSKGCGLERVNEARLRLFTSGKKTLEALPPTQAALYQHIRRAMLQASFFWSQATSVHQDIPDFHAWGWHKDSTGGWLPFWTTFEDSSKACSILLQCGCAKSCTGNCKCCRAGVRCTGLCKCEGGCVNNEDS
jgi:hypothetical protein